MTNLKPFDANGCDNSAVPTNPDELLRFNVRTDLGGFAWTINLLEARVGNLYVTSLSSASPIPVAI